MASSAGFKATVIFVVALILITVGVALLGAAPKTLDEAKAWMHDPATTEDDIARKLVALDTILKADPVVTKEPVLYVLAGRDLVVSGGVTTLDVSFPGKTGLLKLHYTVTASYDRVKDFAPPDRGGELLLWQIATVAAAIGGLALGHFLTR